MLTEQGFGQIPAVESLAIGHEFRWRNRWSRRDFKFDQIIDTGFSMSSKGRRHRRRLSAARVLWLDCDPWKNRSFKGP